MTIFLILTDKNFLGYFLVLSLSILSYLPFPTNSLTMDKRRRKQLKTSHHCCGSEEVSSIEWEFINMTEQEEDLICRMYKLVGERWGLIAGRIPGRKAEEIERFWVMRHSEGFAHRRKELLLKNKKSLNISS